MAIHNAGNEKPLTKNGNRGWYKWIDGASRYICSSKLSADDAMRFWYQNEKSIRARWAKPTRRIRTDALTLAGLLNSTLVSRRAEERSGEITAGYYADICKVCKMIAKTMPTDVLVDSLRPDDFAPLADELARRSPRRQRKIARMVLTIFAHAEQDSLIDRAPNAGRRMKGLANAKIEDLPKPVYSAEECRAILAAIDARIAKYAKTRPDLAASYRQLKLLTLLALNGGFGMKELAKLRVSHVRGKMIESIRTKANTLHRVPLWPETMELLAPMLKDRKPSESLFTTRKGHELTRTRLKGMNAVMIDGPGQTFGDLVAEIGLKRPGHGFYLLKHTHRSASGGAGDESAADVLVGHRLPGMRAIYQQVDEARLRRVSDYVRAWLFNSASAHPADPADPAPADGAS